MVLIGWECLGREQQIEPFHELLNLIVVRENIRIAPLHTCILPPMRTDAVHIRVRYNAIIQHNRINLRGEDFNVGDWELDARLVSRSRFFCCGKYLPLPSGFPTKLLSNSKADCIDWTIPKSRTQYACTCN